MLSYQHIYHAGCLADVHKHAALCALLDVMAQKDKPLSYVETHAARGLYDLQSPESIKTGEAQSGITKILDDNIFKVDHIYMRVLNDIRTQYGADTYPGSPLIAQEILRDQDKIHLCELHPQEYEALKTNIKGKNIKTYKRDGYEALNALSPCTPRRGLVFIDPSFEIKKEYNDIISNIKKLHRKWNVASICVWYPLLPSNAHREMIDNLNDLNLPKTYINEVKFYEPGKETRGMYGSGLFFANIPFGVKEHVEEISNALSMKGKPLR